MKRAIVIFAILLACLFSAEYVDAQTDGLVEISNKSGEKLKICMYRTNNLLDIVPFKCLTLNAGRKVIWSREGDRSNFTVKIFKPALIDKYVRTHNLPGDTTRIIMGWRDSFVYSIDKPKPLVTKYRLRVCNKQWDETVSFTLGFETNTGIFAEGWWNLAKGKCMDVDVSERLKRILGLEYGSIPRTFYFARMYGDNPQEWSGGEAGRPLCVNNKKAFRTFLERGNDGNYLPSPCGADGQKQVSFRLLGEPKADQEYYFLTF